jgi:hypothetical protein
MGHTKKRWCKRWCMVQTVRGRLLPLLRSQPFLGDNQSWPHRDRSFCHEYENSGRAFLLDDSSHLKPAGAAACSCAQYNGLSACPKLAASWSMARMSNHCCPACSDSILAAGLCAEGPRLGNECTFRKTWVDGAERSTLRRLSFRIARPPCCASLICVWRRRHGICVIIYKLSSAASIRRSGADHVSNGVALYEEKSSIAGHNIPTQKLYKIPESETRKWLLDAPALLLHCLGSSLGGRGRKARATPSVNVLPARRLN